MKRSREDAGMETADDDALKIKIESYLEKVLAERKAESTVSTEYKNPYTSIYEMMLNVTGLSQSTTVKSCKQETEELIKEIIGKSVMEVYIETNAKPLYQSHKISDVRLYQYQICYPQEIDGEQIKQLSVIPSICRISLFTIPEEQKCYLNIYTTDIPSLHNDYIDNEMECLNQITPVTLSKDANKFTVSFLTTVSKYFEIEKQTEIYSVKNDYSSDGRNIQSSILTLKSPIYSSSILHLQANGMFEKVAFGPSYNQQKILMKFSVYTNSSQQHYYIE